MSVTSVTLKYGADKYHSGLIEAVNKNPPSGNNYSNLISMINALCLSFIRHIEINNHIIYNICNKNVKVAEDGDITCYIFAKEIYIIVMKFHKTFHFPIPYTG